jgi:hypothetical protein
MLIVEVRNPRSESQTFLKALFPQTIPIHAHRFACEVHQRFGNPAVGAEKAVHVVAFLGGNPITDLSERLLDARF